MQRTAKEFIGQLMDGPLDIIGDVHGEIDALLDLLAALGYNANGRHPAGRRLVFVGDLCDRGPDSVAVIELVSQLVDRRLAQCVLGNHELNLLRASHKRGNGWYFDDNHDQREGRFTTSRQVSPAARRDINAFITGLPMALHHQNLRVVHACWDSDAVRRIALSEEHDVLALYEQFDRQALATLRENGTLVQAEAEKRQYRDALHNPDYAMPFLPALAHKDATTQMANPVRVLIHGAEQPVTTPYFSDGKWRMTMRVAWWNTYHDDIPVVIGHYWRSPIAGVDQRAIGKAGPNLFMGTALGQGLGPRANVHCVDYSIGARFHERATGVPFQTRLAALQWPEQRLTFDNGASIPLSSAIGQTN